MFVCVCILYVCYMKGCNCMKCKYVLCMDMIKYVYTYSFIDVCIFHLFTLPFQNPFFVNSS